MFKNNGSIRIKNHTIKNKHPTMNTATNFDHVKEIKLKQKDHSHHDRYT